VSQVPRDRLIVTLTQQLIATRDPEQTLDLSGQLINAISDRLSAILREELSRRTPERTLERGKIESPKSSNR
jgi:hypothetical protein